MRNGKRHKKERVRSAFNSQHIGCADRDTSPALHQEDSEQSKQGYITITDNTPPT